MINSWEDRSDIRALLFLSSVGIAVLRVTGETGQAFQAAAHLFVGGLIGAAFSGRLKRFPLGLAIALSLVEVFAFLRDRFG